MVTLLFPDAAAAALVAITDDTWRAIWAAIAVVMAASITAAGTGIAAWLTTRNHANDARGNHRQILDELVEIRTDLQAVKSDVATLAGRTDAIEDALTAPDKESAA